MECCSSIGGGSESNVPDSKRQARAQHNALERRRRDNIKDMYTSLKDEIPNFSNDRVSFKTENLFMGNLLIFRHHVLKFSKRQLIRFRRVTSKLEILTRRWRGLKKWTKSCAYRFRRKVSRPLSNKALSLFRFFKYFIFQQ